MSETRSENSFAAGAARILAKLQSSGIPTPNGEVLEDALLDRFSDRDWTYAQALLAAQDKNDWHYVFFPVGSPFIDRLDSVLLAPNREAALGCCLENLDLHRLFDAAIHATSDGCTITRDNRLLAKIARVSFEQSNLEAISRAEKSLKGFRSGYDPQYLKARLDGLPGYKEVAFDVASRWQSQGSGALLLASPSNWVNAMIDLLTRLSISVKRHQAQELVAVFFGAATWHQLVTHQSEPRCWVSPTMVTTNYEDPNAWQFFRTPSEAVFAFGRGLMALSASTLQIETFYLSFFNDSIYATAFKKNHGEDAEPVLTCTGLMGLEFMNREKYIKTAVQMWEQISRQIDIPIRSNDNFENLEIGNQLLSTGNSKLFQFGDYFFSVIEHGETSDRPYLVIEHFINRQRQSTSGWIPIYKAEIYHPHDGADLLVKHDYGRKIVATIPAVSSADCLRIIDFIEQASGLLINCVKGYS